MNNCTGFCNGGIEKNTGLIATNLQTTCKVQGKVVPVFDKKLKKSKEGEYLCPL